MVHLSSYEEGCYQEDSPLDRDKTAAESMSKARTGMTGPYIGIKKPAESEETVVTSRPYSRGHRLDRKAAVA